MIEYLGNKALLEPEMTAFLAPSRVSPPAALPAALRPPIGRKMTGVGGFSHFFAIFAITFVIMTL